MRRVCCAVVSGLQVEQRNGFRICFGRSVVSSAHVDALKPSIVRTVAHLSPVVQIYCFHMHIRCMYKHTHTHTHTHMHISNKQPFLTIAHHPLSSTRALFDSSGVACWRNRRGHTCVLCQLARGTSEERGWHPPLAMARVRRRYGIPGSRCVPTCMSKRRYDGRGVSEYRTRRGRIRRAWCESVGERHENKLTFVAYVFSPAPWSSIVENLHDRFSSALRAPYALHESGSAACTVHGLAFCALCFCIVALTILLLNVLL